MPEVSVIIPTHNRGDFLAESIQSVLQQTFTDIELLVVDDGSIDQPLSVVARFDGDVRFRYLHQENRGDAAARNTGVKNTSGRYLAFLDSDDLWLPDKLRRQVAVLREHSEISVVHSAIVLQWMDEQLQEVSRRTVRRPAFQEKTLYEELLYENVITGSASSVIVRRRSLDQVGLFDEALSRRSDRDLWRRLAERHGFYYLDEPLVCIRKHGANRSNDVQMVAENSIRYFAKLSRDILPQYRYHLPSVAVFEFTFLTIRLLRRGQLLAACATGWIALSSVCCHPDAFLRFIVRFGLLVRRHLARRRRDLALLLVNRRLKSSQP